MLLALDVGNTHTVIGLFEGPRLVADWRVATRHDATADELGVLWRAFFAGVPAAERAIEGMIVSSVVPGLDAVIAAAGRRHVGQEALFVGPGIRTGMPILYENPHEVGADRIVNAVAAKARFGAPVVVVDFGTATTVDVVSPRGEYMGGIIAPGLGVSAEALFAKAARLHRVDLRKPPRVIGRNTEQSIQSGLFHGYVGLVDRLVARVLGELALPAPIVATGGLSALFESELDCLDAVEPGLTLEGLRLIWERNAP